MRRLSTPPCAGRGAVKFRVPLDIINLISELHDYHISIVRLDGIVS